MQRVFRVVDTFQLRPVGPKTTGKFNRSVRRYGVITPVLLAEVPDDDGVIKLTIIDGNRRIRAAKLERLSKIPAVVLKATSAKDRARLTLMCNYMRSANFHTESAAIMALAVDEEAAARAAGAIGLGPVKMQQLFRKISMMPEAVRKAMYEHRVPVTAATWVGNWPEELQQEVISLLERRRYVNTSVLKELRTSYEERHPDAFAQVGARPDDEWIDHGPVHDIVLPGAAEPETLPDVPLDYPIPAVREHSEESHESFLPDAATLPPETQVEPLRPRASAPPKPDPLVERPINSPEKRVVTLQRPTPAAPERPSIESPEPSHSVSGQPSSPAARSAVVESTVRDRPTTPEAELAPSVAARTASRAEQGFAFVVRLDTTMAELVREAKQHNISREVWVDRAMRAWDRTGVS